MRKGIPEAITAGRDTAEQSLGIAHHSLESVGRAILRRVSCELEASLRAKFEGQACLERLPPPAPPSCFARGSGRSGQSGVGA